MTDFTQYFGDGFGLDRHIEFACMGVRGRGRITVFAPGRFKVEGQVREVDATLSIKALDQHTLRIAVCYGGRWYKDEAAHGFVKRRSFCLSVDVDGDPEKDLDVRIDGREEHTRLRLKYAAYLPVTVLLKASPG